MDEHFDVIVLGSGAAGLCAALTCRAAGLSVAVLEKTAYFGGSTAVSGGAVWIPDNPHMAALGIDDSAGQATRYLRNTVGNHLRPAMVESFLRHGPEMVRFLEDHTEVHFIARPGSPDYKPERDGALPGGRTIDPAPFDGRRLGPLFDTLRPPIASFLSLGGMMVNRKDIDALLGMHRSRPALTHATRLLLRYGRDRLRWRRGTRLLLGNALAARLLKSAHDAGVVLRRNVEVRRLDRGEGGVTGVWIAEGAGERRLGATRGVVLATGGFAQNAALRERHMPHAEVHRSMAPAGNTGDGAALAGALGGRIDASGAGAAFWAPVSIMTDRQGRETVFPHLVTDRQKPGLIAVNSAGRRFVNEATSYHDFVAAMHQGGDSCVPAWLVCDSQFLRRYGLGLVRPRTLSLKRFIDNGYLVRARSPAALARRIGVPVDAFEASVRQMNIAAQTGEDPQFGRGASAYDRYLGDAAHTPNPCLGPIETAPFYAVRVWPGDIGTAAGLHVDEYTRVLDDADAPVPGLYACGNDMHSIMGGTYPSAGITLGPALTFGYVAGRTIVQGAAP